MKVALCQTHILWENKKENFKKARDLVKEATCNGANLILFPEMSFTGFSMNVNVTKEKDEITLKYVKGLAREFSVAIGVGWVKEREEKAENHYTVVDATGVILADYTKIHSFLYGGEGEQFLPGNAICNFELENILFVPFVCYDLRFPEVFRIAIERADVFIIPANWPAIRRKHWNSLLQARAIENQSYVLGINCVGNVGGMKYSGDSSIIEPDGGVVEIISEKEGIIYGIIDKKKLEIRKKFPVRDDRREDIYSQLYNKR